MSTEPFWTNMYNTMKTSGMESISGTGSGLVPTEEIVRLLPELFKTYNITSVLDLPCGDHYWMKHVDYTGIQYTGADIVHPLVMQNTKNFPGKVFTQLDMIKDDLPKVDLIISRDCLVHLSFIDAMKALQNMCRSGSKYLLTTTFTQRESNNPIENGGWHPMNLERAPFNLPAPLYLLNEKCPEQGKIYDDKCLGLWDLSQLENYETTI